MNRTQTFLFFGAGALALLGLAIWIVLTFDFSAASASQADESLVTKALEEARRHGLRGNPYAIRTARMTLGQWLGFSGGQLGPGAAQFGLSPETPAFVVGIRGDVRYSGPGSAFRTLAQAETDNIVIVLDARNGNLLSAGTYPSAASMPIQVPLNSLTPESSVTGFPTLPPRTPPTPALAGTPVPQPAQTPEAVTDMSPTPPPKPLYP